MDIPTIISALGGFAFMLASIEEIFGGAQRSCVGAESLVGKTGRVLPPKQVGQESCWVLVEGERWKAVVSSPISPGDTVRVEGVQGLHLVVSGLATSRSSHIRINRSRWQWAIGLILWGIAIISALLSGGPILGALVAGPLVVLLCFAAVIGLSGDGG